MRGWWRRRAQRRARTRREIRDELRFHADGEVERLEGEGVARAEAVRRVKAQLGDEAFTGARMERYTQQRLRRQDRRHTLGGLRRDAVAAVRSLRARPGLSAVSALMLAVGVGATTAMLSVAYGVLWKPLPYHDPDALYLLGGTWPGTSSTSPVAPPVFADWQERARSFESLAGIYRQPLDLHADDGPQRLRGAGVSAELLEVLGVSTAIGRWFNAAEDDRRAAPVAVVSHAFWTRHWNGDTSFLGRDLLLDGRPFTVLGVMPESFHGPEALRLDRIDVWFPLAFIREDIDSHANWFIRTLGRLAPGVSAEAAATEMTTLTGELLATYPPGHYEDGLDFSMASLSALTIGDAADSLGLLTAAVSALLLIACVSVIHLGLASTAARRSELGVRMALGAGRADLVRQLLFESLAIAGIAAAIAVLAARVGIAAIVALGPSDLPRLAELAVRPMVLLPALLLSLGSAVLIGLVAALQVDRGPAATDLSRPVNGRRERRGRNVLVGLEMAFAVALLVGAAVLANSFVRLRAVDPGFDPGGVTLMHVSLGDRYPAREGRVVFFESVLEGLRALPGVSSAALANGVPFGEGAAGGSFVIENGPETELPPFARWQLVSDGFVATLGGTIVDGRGLAASDMAADEPVVLVNEAFARMAWPDRPAIGERLKIIRTDDDSPWSTVAGVVADTKQSSLDRATAPEVYVPYQRAPVVFPQVDFLARVAAGSTPGASLRQAVWRVDPLQPIAWIDSLSSRIGGSLAEERFYLSFLATFACLSVALACGGVYAALSYLVGRRTREIGIRMAVGAGPSRVVGAVVRDGMVPVLIGAALGIGVAITASGLLESYVYGVSPTDPVTLIAVLLVLLPVAGFAAWVPARRASRVDPVSTLRR